MGSTILIIDDDKELTRMLKQFFQFRNYNVLTAENGILALKKAEENPDLILLDINMPRISAVFTVKSMEELC